MPKVRYDAWEIRQFEKTEEGRKYLEYNQKISGKPIGLTVPVGYPAGVEEMGGVTAVYEKCLEQGVTWEELLEQHLPKKAEI